jgi:hypothetical protein
MSIPKPAHRLRFSVKFPLVLNKSCPLYVSISIFRLAWKTKNMYSIININLQKKIFFNLLAIYIDFTIKFMNSNPVCRKFITETGNLFIYKVICICAIHVPYYTKPAGHFIVYFILLLSLITCITILRYSRKTSRLENLHIFVVVYQNMHTFILVYQNMNTKLYKQQKNRKT